MIRRAAAKGGQGGIGRLQAAEAALKDNGSVSVFWTPAVAEIGSSHS